MNWDAIKLFLALHREGSARSVASSQGLSPSTVTRKISELEKELGSKLFARRSSGFSLSGAGEDLLNVALRMEADAYEIERKLLAQSGIMQGTIRLTIPNHLIGHPLVESLAEFSALHPLVNLELIPSFEAFDLARGEADVALRIFMRDAPPPENLIGTRLAEIHCAVYATQKYLDTHDLSVADGAHWLGWEDESPSPDWVLSSQYPHLKVKHSFNDPFMQLFAAKAHMGLAMMPCFMCDPETDLLRVPADHKWHRFDLWMLSHPDLRDTMRFRELRSFFKAQFAAQRYVWTGDSYHR